MTTALSIEANPGASSGTPVQTYARIGRILGLVSLVDAGWLWIAF